MFACPVSQASLKSFLRIYDQESLIYINLESVISKILKIHNTWVNNLQMETLWDWSYSTKKWAPTLSQMTLKAQSTWYRTIPE